jgi:hypothetical protein
MGWRLTWLSYSEIITSLNDDVMGCLAGWCRQLNLCSCLADLFLGVSSALVRRLPTNMHFREMPNENPFMICRNAMLLKAI